MVMMIEHTPKAFWLPIIFVLGTFVTLVGCPVLLNFLNTESADDTIPTITIDGTKAQGEWDYATMNSFQFVFTSKTLDANVYMMNNEQNLYIALEVFADDYYSYSTPDDRLFISFDENNDSQFTDFSEDRLSFFTRNGSMTDWYWENASLQWEYSQEQNNPDDDKEVAFTHSNMVDGGVGDYFIEVKVPFDCTDPQDLQTQLGESAGFCIKFGNVDDGYRHYPTDILTENNPLNFGTLTLQADGKTTMVE